MLGRKRAFVLICVAALSAGCLPSSAAEWIDTTKLPRIEGAKELFVSPGTTQFTVPLAVPLAAEVIAQKLAAEGWQQYGRPSSSARLQDEKMALLEFKKGRDGLTVYISVAPAQGYATAVGYTASALTNNLPFPKFATNIGFDHERPHLTLMTPDSVDETLEFFRQELVTLGWIPWSLKEGANPASDAAGTKHEKGAYAYYVRNAERPFAARPLLLTIQRAEDGRGKVELKGIPVDLLMEQSKQGHDTKEYVEFETKRAAEKEKAEAETKARAEARAQAQAKVAQERSESEARHAELIRKAQETARQAIEDAMAQVKVPAVASRSPARNPAVAAGDALATRADNPAPIPLPENAEEIDYDGRNGRLEFESKSSVQALAAFHRAMLKPLGWKEKPTVINRPNMVVLEFSKLEQKLSFTIMQMGPRVNVSASGSGLVTISSKTVAVERSGKATGQGDVKANVSVRASASVRLDPSANGGPSVKVESSVKDVSAKEVSVKSGNAALEAEDNSGLPAPTERTRMGTEKTPFRIVLTASVAADLPAVLDFYRRELGKRNWKEQTSNAVVKPEQAAIAFMAPEGPALLKLERDGGETTIELSLRKQVEAQKAGMLPKDGQAKMLFGNMVMSEAVITINKQTIRVGAGVGAKKPDGPTIDLPPGKYKYAFRVGGKSETDEVEVRAGETWGMVFGPGGALALQVY